MFNLQSGMFVVSISSGINFFVIFTVWKTSKMFVQKLNAIDGKMEWVVENDYDLRNEIARSTYSGMLHDTERNRKYYEALRQTVRDLRSHGKTFIQGLDIGAGTGILSMMAAKAGVDHVIACESFEPMSKTAQKVIDRNKLENVIQVVNKTSTDLLVPEDMPQKANILVTEIFDTELIGEGVLSTLRDAHKRLLSPDCKVIPSSAHVNVQLIQSDWLWCMNKLNNKSDVKLSQKYHECPGTASAHEVQINQLYPDNLTLLSDAEKMTSFDFQTSFDMKFSFKGAKYSSAEIKTVITSSGIIHAVLLWWDLVLHDGKNITLSMEPEWIRKQDEKYVWRDHWMQAVYYVKKPVSVVSGDVVFVKMFHDDYSIWFDVSKCQRDFVDRPLCICGLHVSWPRERFAMLNNNCYQNCIKMLIMQNKNEDKTILIAGDSSLLPLQFCRESFNSSIKYVEYSQSSQNVVKKLAVVNKLTDKIKVLSKFSEESVQQYADIFIAEPYLSSSLLPWHHYQIWYLINKLRSNNGDLKIYPSKGILKACIVQLEDLWKVRTAVKNVEGFDLSDFDLLIKEALSPVDITGHGLFQTLEPFSMWEFKSKLLSNTEIIAEFNFQESLPERSVQFNGNITVSNAGFVHAVVIWTEFELADGIRWSTGLNENNEWVNYSKQGVFFMNDHNKTNVDYSVVFLPDECEMMFQFC